MNISLRHFIREAGEKEAKFITGINFDFAKNKLIESGNSSPTPAEIKSYVEVNDYEMPINAEKRNLIKSKKIEINERICLNANESLLLITGSVLTSVSENEINQKIENIKWYLVFKELNPGDIEKDSPFVKTDLNSIIETFNQFYSKVLELKIKTEKAEKESKENSEKNKYKTPLNHTFIKYTFKNGWKVVYVPAAGEDIGEGQTMPIFGDNYSSSYDRILEGNKMGICLGEQTRYYQDNSYGEIYSIRDLNNEPKATIRISRKSLQECKGKGNSTPSVEVCALAKEWFNNEGIDYNKNEDYKKFPPLTAEDALNEFTKNTIKAYDFGNKWISYWYGKGIKEIDNDVKKKIELNDPKVLVLANRFPALVQKVYEYLCSELTDDSDLENHRELRENLNYYLQLKCSKKIFKLLAKNLYIEFLDDYSDKPGAKEFIPIAYKNAAELNPLFFLNDYSDKPDAKEFIPIAYKNLAELNPSFFLNDYSDKPDAKEFIAIAYKNLAEKDTLTVLNDYYKNPDDKPYAKEFIHIAHKNAAKRSPLTFLKNYSDKPDAKEFIPIAYKNLAEKDPLTFLNDYSNKPVAKELIPIAYKNLAEEYPLTFLNDYYKNPDNKPYPKEFIHIAYKNAVEQEPITFLNDYSYRPDAKEFIPIAYENLAKVAPEYILNIKNVNKKYKEIAIKNLFSTLYNFEYFLSIMNKYSYKTWFNENIELIYEILSEKQPSVAVEYLKNKPNARYYLDQARFNLAKKEPSLFLEKYENEKWAQPYLLLAKNNLDKEASFSRGRHVKTSKYKQLKSLAFILDYFGLKKEVGDLRKIF